MRLGLDDSDLELSDDLTDSPPLKPTRHGRETAPKASTSALKRTRSPSEPDDAVEDEDESEADDAPPRAPRSDEEDEDADDLYSPRRPTRLRRRTVSPTASASLPASDEQNRPLGDDDDEDSEVVSDDATSEGFIPALTGRKVNRLGWPTDVLGTEPGRRELMQATLFAKPPTVKPPPQQPVRLAFEPLPKRSAPRPPREYPRVPIAQSCTASHEGAIVDAGLSLGRSFRASFGPQGQLVRIDNLRSARDPSVFISKPRLLSETDEAEITRARRTLSVQLEHTTIRLGLDGIPEAVTQPTLRFRDFDDIADSDVVESNVWRLGAALFDDVDLQLDTSEDAFEIERVRGHVERLRRRALLSDWLESAVKGDVANDLADGRLDAVFARLSGHQLELACDAALAQGDVRLASLLAQAGGDLEFRRDVRLQLDKWREYRVDAHISTEHRRIYEVLAGNVTVSPGTGRAGEVDHAPAINIAAGLDWKRAFGLHFWYGSVDAPLSGCVERYLAAVRQECETASPRPAYVESPIEGQAQWSAPTIRPDDPLFELIRLSCDSTRSLETALTPRGFTSSPFDLRMSWHLYTILANALRVRDFSDLPDPLEAEAMGLQHRPASATADQMASSLAYQLEQIGLVHWAVFVLLHLPSPESRSCAIRELLARNAAELTDATQDFLVSTLAVPSAWIHDALALEAESENDLWTATQHFLAAEDYDSAHRIIVDHLAPEAVLREDIHLLRDLLEPLPAQVSGWSTGGQVFLDYADAVEEIPMQLRAVRDHGIDAAVTRRGDTLDSLIFTVLPRAIDGASERLHNAGQIVDAGQALHARACYTAMLSALSTVQSSIQLHHPTGTSALLEAVTGSDRLALLQAGATLFASSLKA